MDEQMTVHERLQERIKRLINERNALRAEVNRLDPTGDIWQRTQSDLEAWRQAYLRTKAQRDELLAACEAAYELVANMGDVEELRYHGQGESALREMLRAAIAKARGE